MLNKFCLQGSVTFKSVNYPTRYIRHQGYRLKLREYDGTELFRKDASFQKTQGKSCIGICA